MSRLFWANTYRALAALFILALIMDIASWGYWMNKQALSWDSIRAYKDLNRLEEKYKEAIWAAQKDREDFRQFLAEQLNQEWERK